MTKIPTFTRQRAGQFTPSTAPLPVQAADVGAGAIGRGLQAVGKGVSDVGEFLFKVEEIKQQERDTADYWKGLGEYQAANNGYFSDLREGKIKDSDGNTISPDEFVNSYSAVTSQQDKILERKSDKAQGRLKNYFAFHDPINIAKIDNMAFKLRQSEDLAAMDVTIDAKLEAAADAERPQEAQAFLGEINTLIEENTPQLIDAVQAKKIKDSVKDRFEQAIHDSDVNNVHAAIEAGQFGEGKDDLGLAGELAKSEAIPEKEQTTLRNAIRSAKATAKNKGVTLQQTAIDLNYENIAKSLAGDVDSINLSNMSDTLEILPLKDAQAIEVVFNHRTSELNKGNPDPFLELNPQIRATLQRTLELDASALSPNKLFSFIGKGLTPDAFQGLNDFRTLALTKDSPLQQPDVKNALSVINNIRRLDTPDSVQDIVELSNKENQLKQRIFEKVKEGVRGAELKKFTDDMVAPVTESAVGNWLGSWYRGTFPQFLGGNVPGIGRTEDISPEQRFKQPKTVRQFEAFVDEVNKSFGADEAEAYYELWKGDFE